MSFSFSLIKTYRPKETKVENFPMFVQIRLITHDQFMCLTHSPAYRAIHHYSLIYMHNIYLEEKSSCTERDQHRLSTFNKQMKLLSSLQQ